MQNDLTFGRFLEELFLQDKKNILTDMQTKEVLNEWAPRLALYVKAKKAVRKQRDGSYRREDLVDALVKIMPMSFVADDADDADGAKYRAAKQIVHDMKQSVADAEADLAAAKKECQSAVRHSMRRRVECDVIAKWSAERTAAGDTDNLTWGRCVKELDLVVEEGGVQYLIGSRMLAYLGRTLSDYEVEPGQLVQ